jgi:hypothetical protein
MTVSVLSVARLADFLGLSEFRGQLLLCSTDTFF